jgi:hypothetical protein
MFFTAYLVRQLREIASIVGLKGIASEIFGRRKACQRLAGGRGLAGEIMARPSAYGGVPCEVKLFRVLASFRECERLVVGAGVVKDRYVCANRSPDFVR